MESHDLVGGGGDCWGVCFTLGVSNGSEEMTAKLGTIKAIGLAPAVCLYREVLPDFCAKHGVELDDIKSLQVRFGTDAAYGRHFLVTVENARGRRSAVRYFGVPGKRVRRVR